MREEKDTLTVTKKQHQHQLTDDDNTWHRTNYFINEIFGVDIIMDDGIGCGYIVPSPEPRSGSIGNYVSTPHG
jgi:hypothetical protein